MAEEQQPREQPQGAPEFSFPVLAPPKVPLTARSTVVDRSAAGPASTSAPVPLAEVKRNKVPLEKGYSQVDWIRLSRSGADLAGLKGERPRKNITKEEVASHKTPEDAWMVLRGKVYNIGPYLRFHPGGASILMSVAGKDGTAAFQRYHPWVNGDALLEKCLVGWLGAPPGDAIAEEQ